MDKEAQVKIEAEYKFWTGNCPHPDFIKHIIEIIGGEGYRKLPKDKPPLIEGSNDAIRFEWLNPEGMFYVKRIARAQREMDIKFYGGK